MLAAAVLALVLALVVALGVPASPVYASVLPTISPPITSPLVSPADATPTPSQSTTPAPTPTQPPPTTQPPTPSTPPPTPVQAPAPPPIPTVPLPTRSLPVALPPVQILPSQTPEQPSSPPASPPETPEPSSSPSAPPSLPGAAYNVRKPAAAGHPAGTPVPVVIMWAPVAAVSQPGGALVPPIFTRLPAVFTALLTLVLWILALGAAVRLVGGRRVSDWLRTWRMNPVQRRVAVHHGIRPVELATLSEEALRRLQEEAAVDPLTGTLSRKAGIAALNRAVAVAERYAGSLCVAMVGLEGFNDIEDEQDRAAADQYLRGVATCLRQRLRFEDLIVRYTANEYVCVLVQAPPEQAAKVMEEIQQSARAKGWKFTHGLTCYQAGDHTVDLITRATQEMQKRRPGETVALV